jgi:hypothetical protein
MTRISLMVDFRLTAGQITALRVDLEIKLRQPHIFCNMSRSARPLNTSSLRVSNPVARVQGTLGSQIVILAVTPNHLQAKALFLHDFFEQHRRSNPIINTRRRQRKGVASRFDATVSA